MNEQIHEILKKAGVAKGITQDEAGILMILANDDLLEMVKNKIHEQKDISPENAERAILELEIASDQYKSAQQQVVKTFQKCEEKALQDRKQKLQKLQHAFDEIFPKTL